MEVHSNNEFYKQLSETSLNLMMSQGLENLCEVAFDFLAQEVPHKQIALAVFNVSKNGFDFFDMLTAQENEKTDFDQLHEQDVWSRYFFSEALFNKRDLTDTPAGTAFKKHGLASEKILHFPMDYKGNPIGDIILFCGKGSIPGSHHETVLAAISQAMAYRITEIRRFYGLGRHSGKKDEALDAYFKRPSEDEVLFMLCQQLMKSLQADVGLYMHYHEGFRFLYPKYLYRGENGQNLFEKEKPPVLLLKDFSTFEKMFDDKEYLILDSKGLSAAKDILQVPGIDAEQVHNVLIFTLKVAQSVEGFFLLGKESIIKKFTRNEINDSLKLLQGAQDALEENQILRQAKLTVKQLERIFEIGTELTLDLNLADVLKKISGAIRRTLGWNVVMLDMKNTYDDNFNSISVLGISEKNREKLLKESGYPTFKKRIKSTFKISNSYFYDHKLFTEKDAVKARQKFLDSTGTEWNDNDWLYAPITSRGKLLGVISLNDPVERTRPNEERIRSVEFFANQAAVVMENAELFESLKSSEFRYRQLAETMTMGLVTCNNDGEILYINDSLVNILDYNKKDEFLNKKISDFCEEKSRHKLNKMLTQVLLQDDAGSNKNEVGDLEIEMMAKSGEMIPFMIYASPFYQTKKRVGYFAVLADLRSQKKLERMRSDFNSMIVHDLRSPLNIIQGYVDIVRTEVVGKVNEEQAELLTIAKDNVFKVLKLIDNFLTASKLEAGHLNIEPEVNSINTLIEDLADQYQVLAKEKKIKLSKTLDENIPFLYFDKFRLEQVFRNYLSNALKFTPPEGNISIVSKLRKKKNDKTGETDLFVEASVSDTGVGISKDEMHKVFNKYEQTEAGKDASLKGTGLGLAICREIVELHKGEVWVESKLHEGSKFGFTLPIQPVEV
jgi:PAS domain S-box-containing protein